MVTRYRPARAPSNRVIRVSSFDIHRVWTCRSTRNRGPAQVLRDDPTLVPLLRLRIADMGTRLHDLKVNNRAVAEGLQAILKEQP